MAHTRPCFGRPEDRPERTGNSRLGPRDDRPLASGAPKWAGREAVCKQACRQALARRHAVIIFLQDKTISYCSADSLLRVSWVSSTLSPMVL